MSTTTPPPRRRRPGRPPVPPVQTPRPKIEEEPKQPIERFAFRIPEAAESLGISAAALERRVKEGTVPSVKLHGIRLIMRKTLVDLDLILTEQQSA